MSESRIRIKFGEHEFEVEGPEELVKSQFELFRRLVWPKTEIAKEDTGVAAKPAPPQAPPFNKMVLLRGRFVYLSVPAKVEDAILMLLLAQKQFRKNEDVSGGEIMGGLRLSGIRIPRADNLLIQHATAGSLSVKGSGRMRRYRLTAAGIERAQAIVSKLSPLV